MEAIQVSEASMVSMFRRAADAIVNESSLKDEVTTLQATTSVLTGQLERLGNDKSALNDYVAELQRQLSEARRESAERRNDLLEAQSKIDLLEDNNKTLETLLSEAERERDNHMVLSNKHYAMWNDSEDRYINAKAKLDNIMKTLGAIVPQAGQSEERPTESATSHMDAPNTSHSDAAPEVAAEATFPQGSQQPSVPVSGSSGDTAAHVEDYSSPQEPIEPNHPSPSSPDEPVPHKQSAWDYI